MRIVLERSDVIAAVAVATFHTLRCIVRDAVPKNNQDPKNRLDDTLAGYLAENAVARALGVSWPQPHTLAWEGRKEGDLIVNGHAIEVRSSPHPHAAFLLGQREDPDDRFYVMVVPVADEAHTYDVLGGVQGKDMKQERFFCDRAGKGRPCFWFPVSDLRPLGDRA